MHIFVRFKRFIILRFKLSFTMQSLRFLLLIVLSVVSLSSCHISRNKKGPSTGPVVIVKDSKAGHHKDYKKGWTKNPNNPHHPRTTNPGHTKHKQGKGGNTVIIVNNNNTTVKQAAPKGNPGKGGKQHHNNGAKGNGNQSNKGGNGKSNGKGK